MNSSTNFESSVKQSDEPSDLELALEISIRIDEATESLYEFVKYMWSIVEPGVKFQDAWHIKAICDHLQALTMGPGHPFYEPEKHDATFFRNLLINVPPGHAKSLIVCVFWPAWVWIKWPACRFMFGSYADSLSIRDSVKCRDLIRSPKYRQSFGITWSLSDDMDQKSRFINTMKGYRIATSVGGSGTGERADIICVDDALNAIQAESEVFRVRANDWWNITMSTRDADPKTSRRVCVMQRLHEMDLAGTIIKQGGYEHLMLAAEFDPARKCKTKIYEDPRKVAGELLWPNVYGPQEIAEKKKALGSRGFSGQFQQNPVPADGGLFKRKWWKFYRALPEGNWPVVTFWDTAQEVGISNDYSVCAKWMKHPTGYFLLDLWREKVETPDLEKAAKNIFPKSPVPMAVIIEKKNSGAALIQYLRRDTTQPVISYLPKLSKEVRASAATPTVEAGNCFLPEGVSWVEDFISEHEKFPLGEHDDMVDTTSMMVEYFANMSNNQPRVRSL